MRHKHYCADCGEEIKKSLCPICQCGGWLPFPATRPEPHDHHVLVYTAANNQYVARLGMAGCWILSGGKRLIEEGEVVTHWRRLLDPPSSNDVFAMSYSGFSTGSPANISVDGHLFQIHAEDANEVQRLVILLNSRYGKESNT